MAIVSNVLIGKASGSVGGATFSTWKGKNVLKSKATVVANPQTDKQIAQRTAFANLVTLYRLMVAIISLGYKELAIGKSAFNAFLGFNVKNAYDKTTPPAATFIPENFKCSQGTIASVIPISLVADDSDATIVVDYPTTKNKPGQSAGDFPLMMVYNATKEEWAGEVGTVTRSDGSMSITMPTGWAINDVLHAYLGFSSPDGQTAADSVRIQGVVEA